MIFRLEHVIEKRNENIHTGQARGDMLIAVLDRDPEEFLPDEIGFCLKVHCISSMN
jgi:hypothetical protein